MKFPAFAQLRINGKPDGKPKPFMLELVPTKPVSMRFDTVFEEMEFRTSRGGVVAIDVTFKGKRKPMFRWTFHEYKVGPDNIIKLHGPRKR